MIPEAYLDGVLDIWAERGETHTCAISGNSMAPLIKHGDSMVIEHGNREICIGDVVIFKTADKILAHRLIRRKNRGKGEIFICKGDNCSTFDQPITAEQILGKVVEVRGANGHFYLKSAFGRFLKYLFTALSLASEERHLMDSIFWKEINCFFAFSLKILPKGLSIRCILLKIMLEAKKMRVYV